MVKLSRILEVVKKYIWSFILACATVFLLFRGKMLTRNYILLICAVILFLTLLYEIIVNKFFKYIKIIHSSFSDALIVVLFFCIITGQLLLTNGSITVADNRNLSPTPYLFLPNNHINTKFPSDFDNWLADHFGLRKQMVNVAANINVGILGVSNSEKVVIGKNGWLFYSNSSDGDCVANYQNTSLYSPEELEQIKKCLLDKQAFLKSQGIKFILFLAPNKETIYGDDYLSGYNKTGQLSKTDQVMNFIKSNTDIPVVDPRAVLKKNKHASELYFKADTHWNYMGGFLGYQSLMYQIQKFYPNIPIQQASDFNTSKVSVELGDLTGMMGLTKYQYIGTNYLFTPKTNLKYDYHYLLDKNSPDFTTTLDNKDLPAAKIV